MWSNTYFSVIGVTGTAWGTGLLEIKSNTKLRNKGLSNETRKPIQHVYTDHT